MTERLTSSSNKLQNCYLIKFYLQNCFYPRTIFAQSTEETHCGPTGNKRSSLN